MTVQAEAKQTVEQLYNITNDSKRVDTWVEFFLYAKSEAQIMAQPGASPISEEAIEETVLTKNGNGNGKGKHKKKQIPTDGIYFNQILNMRAAKTAILNLNYDDLVIAHDVIHENIRKDIPLLMYQIKERYPDAIVDIRKAVVRILREEMTQDDHALYVDKHFRLSVYNFDVIKELPELNNEDVLKFVKVEGLLAQLDNQPSIIIKESTWYCKDGHANVLPGDSTIRKCTNIDEDGECKASLIDEDIRKQVRSDFFYIRIQERPDRMRSGRYEPQEIDVYIEGTELITRLYGILRPGMNVAVNGMITVTGRSKSSPGEVGLEMEGSSVEVMEDASLLENDEEYDNLVARDIDRGQIHAHVKKMITSYAPQLANVDDIKHALLLQAIGSDPKTDENKLPIRGDMNILLIGDPASGKSTSCHYSENIRPGSVYNQGKGSTAVGLTGGIETVDVFRNGQKFSKKRVSFGAYLLARDKIVIIDELEKRDPDDYEDISHPMDDWQQVHIRKHGIIKSFSARCGSLHAGNPIKNRGKYDPTLTIYEQTNFPEWLLSRYDLIFIMRSVMNDEERSKMWHNIRRSYSTVKASISVDDPNYKNVTQAADNDGTTINEGWGYDNPNDEIKAEHYSVRYMRREIMYLRRMFHPICKPDTIPWAIMHEFWNKYNKINILPQIADSNDGSNNNLHLPSTDTRKIYTLLRLAEASARLNRRNEVLMEDMTDAIKLVKLSISQQIPERGDTSKLKKSTISKFVNSINQFAYKLRTEEVKKKANLVFKSFTVLNREFIKSTFITCEDCRGSKLDGSVANLNPSDVLDSQMKCPKCKGIGGHYEKFTYGTFEGLAKNVGIPAEMAFQFFNFYLKLEFFFKDDRGFYYVDEKVDLREKYVWNQLREAIDMPSEEQQQQEEPKTEKLRGAIVQ